MAYYVQTNGVQIREEMEIPDEVDIPDEDILPNQFNIPNQIPLQNQNNVRNHINVPTQINASNKIVAPNEINAPSQIHISHQINDPYQINSQYQINAPIQINIPDPINISNHINVLNYSLEVQQPVQQNVMYTTKNLCRICGNRNFPTIHLFKPEAMEHCLVQKINKYLPIVVGKDDRLPLWICQSCINTLLKWHDLVETCETTDRKLSAKLNKQSKTKSGKNPKNQGGVRGDSGSTARLTTPYLVLTLKEVLNNDYFKILDVSEENSDLLYVCQMCPENPASRSIESLSDHLISSHNAELNDKTSVEAFIKENITFEEVLTNDCISDSESENQIVDIPNYFCPCCESVFSSPTRLICHLNKHVEVSIDEGVHCCDNLYTDKKTFVLHLQDKHVTKTTDAVLVCKTCGSIEDNKEALESHINDKHSNAEDIKKKIQPNLKCQKFIPAVCPECNKTFSNKYNMLTHMKNHSKVPDSKFVCNKCNKTYKNRGSLTYHQKVFHEGLLRFLCSMCGEAFPSRMARDTHARIHTGFRPFSCKYCSKSYRAQNTLNRHIDMHLNIRKYECHLCPKKFRKRTHLDYHLKTHEKKK